MSEREIIFDDNKTPAELHTELRTMFEIIPPSVDVEHKQIARKYDPKEKVIGRFFDKLIEGGHLRYSDDPNGEIKNRHGKEDEIRDSLKKSKPAEKRKPSILRLFHRRKNTREEEFDFINYNQEVAEYDAEVFKSRTNPEINEPLKQKLEGILSPEHVLITPSYRNKIVEQYFYFRFSGRYDNDIYQTHGLRELYTELGLGDPFGIGIFDGNPIERERATFRRLKNHFDFIRGIAASHGHEFEEFNFSHSLSQGFPESGHQYEKFTTSGFEIWAHQFEDLYGCEP